MRSLLLLLLPLLLQSSFLPIVPYTPRATIDPTIVKEVFIGVLEGVGAEAQLTSIENCLNDLYTAGADLVQAVELFEKKDAQSVLAGLKLLGEAIELIPDAMTQCQTAVEDAKRLYEMIANFKSPLSFAYHVGKDILVNGVQIYKEIDSAVTDYNSANWRQFGYDCGYALGLVLIGSQSKLATPTLKALDPTIVKEVFIGVLEGVGAEAQLTSVENCLKDLYTAGADLVQAVELFEKQDAQSVLAGLKLLGQAIELIPDACTECQTALNDAKRLYEMIANFKSPLSFAYHVGKDIIVNGVQIYKEIDSAITDYKGSNWRQFGYDCGYALGLVLVGSKINQNSTTLVLKALDPTIVKEVFIGVLEGVGAEAQLTSVETCLKDLYTAGADLVQAVELFEKQDAQSVLAGLKLLGQAIELIPDACTECQTALNDAKRLYEMIANFKSPLSFAYHVGKDIIVNGVQIYKEIDSAITDYKGSNWRQFGYDCGYALGLVLVGTKINQNSSALKTLDPTIVKEVFIGVLEGVGAEAQLTSVENCLKDLYTAGADLVQAVELFKKQDAQSVLAGLKLLGQALQLIPDALTECHTAINDAKRLYEMIATFTSPLSFAYHVGKDILVNGVQIYKEIDSAITDYNSSNWRQFGYDCGYALGLVLIGTNLNKNITTDSFEKTKYEKFEKLSEEEFKGKYLGLGLRRIDDLPRVSYKGLLKFATLPEAFDSRNQWPNCIHTIRNQLHCGSCWAFAGSEVLSDRFCIASKGAINDILSPQFMVSCDTSNQGCQGGNLPYAWNFLEKTGIVSESCLPYHSGDGSDFPCYKFQKCEDGSELRHYFVKAGTSKVFEDVDSIKLEIMTHGPVETGFLVFENFKDYKSGVYAKGANPGKELGGHAVKIVGWGKDHWIAANSWDVTWGEQGFFRIGFGECYIDTDAVAGVPDLERK